MLNIAVKSPKQVNKTYSIGPVASKLEVGDIVYIDSNGYVRKYETKRGRKPKSCKAPLGFAIQTED
jgi:hypothetical protein